MSKALFHHSQLYVVVQNKHGSLNRDSRDFQQLSPVKSLPFRSFKVKTFLGVSRLDCCPVFGAFAMICTSSLFRESRNGIDFFSPKSKHLKEMNHNGNIFKKVFFFWLKSETRKKFRKFETNDFISFRHRRQKKKKIWQPWKMYRSRFFVPIKFSEKPKTIFCRCRKIRRLGSD